MMMISVIISTSALEALNWARLFNPTRIPLGLVAGCASLGTAFLLTRIPADSRAFSTSSPFNPRGEMFKRIKWLSVPPVNKSNPSSRKSSAIYFARVMVKEAVAKNSGDIMYAKAHAFAAIEAALGVPCSPGNTAFSMRFSSFPGSGVAVPPRIRPPLGPAICLYVLVVTISA